MVIRKLKKPVRVHLKSGPTLEGLRGPRMAGLWRLYEPKQIDGTDQTVSLDGVVEIDPANVHYWQILR